MEAQAQSGFIQGVYTFMIEGGIFMWIILALWLFGLALSVERFIRLKLFDINASKFFLEIHGLLLKNDLQGALNICQQTGSAVAFIFKAGLKKVTWPLQAVQHTLDTATLEMIPLLEKRLNYIALAANISTLLGLLGTIQGLIESFSAVAGADPAEKAKLLALGISKAMNTTALGLLSAISLMVIHAYLTNRSEKIITDIDEYSSKFIENFVQNRKGNSDSNKAA
jgi:biopolymer transport protein ExbB